MDYSRVSEDNSPGRGGAEAHPEPGPASLPQPAVLSPDLARQLLGSSEDLLSRPAILCQQMEQMHRETSFGFMANEKEIFYKLY